MGLSVQTIDSFIAPGSPLAKAGGAQTLLRATGGSLTGAAFLAALARKESSFGAQAFAPNNFWGYGVHLGPDVNTAPTVEAMAARVWKGLSGGLYRGSGLTDPTSIIRKYAPPGENDTGLYQSQVRGWFSQMGLDPNTNIFTGSRVPVGASTSPMSGSAPTPRAAAGAQVAPTAPLSSATQKALQTYIVQSRNDVLAGRNPRDPMGVLARIAAESNVATSAGTPVGNVHGVAAAPAAGGGPAITNPAGRYGFPTGGVDSGQVFYGGEGGDWGGSLERALAIAKAVGATPSSQKRSRKLTASGNPSDHWIGSTASYATDLPTSGAAGDTLLTKVSAALGVPLRAGIWNNVNIGGYRYQVGWRVPGHFDHIHVGVRRL